MTPEEVAAVLARIVLPELVGCFTRLKETEHPYILHGACPWCEGRLAVQGRRGFFHCFGCKASGTAIDWMMKMHGESFRDAVERLRRLADLNDGKCEDEP